MKLLICGGRDFNDWKSLHQTLSKINAEHGISCIIHGGALGADSLANDWASLYHIPVHIYKANWNLHGRNAGILRNQQMLDEGKPDLVIAFPTGGPGTNHMISISRAAKIETRVFNSKVLGSGGPRPLNQKLC